MYSFARQRTRAATSAGSGVIGRASGGSGEGSWWSAQRRAVDAGAAAGRHLVDLDVQSRRQDQGQDRRDHAAACSAGTVRAASGIGTGNVVRLHRDAERGRSQALLGMRFCEVLLHLFRRLGRRMRVASVGMHRVRMALMSLRRPRQRKQRGHEDHEEQLRADRPHRHALWLARRRSGGDPKFMNGVAGDRQI
jgi:hypothetical protein